VILTQPLENNPSYNTSKLLDKLDTTLSILTNEIFLNDLKEIVEKNELVLKYNDPNYRYIPVKLICPAVDYGDPLHFNPSNIAAMINAGYNAPVREFTTDLLGGI